MFEHFQAVGLSLQKLETELSVMKTDIRDNRKDIGELQQNSVLTQDLIDLLTEKVEKLDVQARERNLKFFGVYEPTRWESSDDTAEVISVLNYYSSERWWTERDIDRTFRIGRTGSGGQPRPLVVSFSHVSDKLFILKDTELRAGLRRANVRVANDLTVRQKQQADYLKEEGKIPIFRNGRLEIDGALAEENIRDRLTTADDILTDRDRRESVENRSRGSNHVSNGASGVVVSDFLSGEGGGVKQIGKIICSWRRHKTLYRKQLFRLQIMRIECVLHEVTKVVYSSRIGERQGL